MHLFLRWAAREVSSTSFLFRLVSMLFMWVWRCALYPFKSSSSTPFKNPSIISITIFNKWSIHGKKLISPMLVYFFLSVEEGRQFFYSLAKWWLNEGIKAWFSERFFCESWLPRFKNEGFSKYLTDRKRKIILEKYFSFLCYIFCYLYADWVDLVDFSLLLESRFFYHSFLY